MLEKIKASYERLLKSEEFKPEGFLCGAFIICNLEDLNKTHWQIDFYKKESDTMTTYLMAEKIEKTNEAEVFKTENMKVEELKLDEIKKDYEDIEKKLKLLLEDKDEIPVKITIILQKQGVPIWNFIYITKKFNLVNIKIDGINGEVIEEKLVNLLSFEKGDRKKEN